MENFIKSSKNEAVRKHHFILTASIIIPKNDSISFQHNTYCPLMQDGLCRNWKIL